MHTSMTDVKQWSRVDSQQMEMKFEEVFNDRPSPLEKKRAG